MSSSEIFSSTGELGAQIRQNERWYINGGFSNNPRDIEATFEDGLEQLKRNPATISRVVFRSLVGEQARAAILESDLQRDIEVLLPISAGQHLLYLARNAPGREGGDSVDELVQQTHPDSYKSSVTPLADHITQATDAGYQWQGDFSADEVPGVLDLWGPTFGWDKSEVSNLQARMEHEAAAASEDRSVWVSFARHNDELVAAAMAERLDLPGKDGPIALVESTEWRVRADYQRRNNPKAPRLMVATLALLNAQVIHSIGSERTSIFAECNLRSRADRAGRGAGFRAPERQVEDGRTIPQILRNNVEVDDGLAAPGDALPHFLFQHVPPHIVERDYTHPNIETMLEVTGIGR